MGSTTVDGFVGDRPADLTNDAHLKEGARFTGLLSDSVCRKQHFSKSRMDVRRGGTNALVATPETTGRYLYRPGRTRECCSDDGSHLPGSATCRLEGV